MSKCAACGDISEYNYSWVTSRGLQCANLCGCCGTDFWNSYKNTPSGQSLIISPMKSKEEIENCYAAYNQLLTTDHIA